MRAREFGERRGGWLTPTIFTVAALAILIGLGIWQLERKTWKEALIARLDARIAAPATVGLPPRDQWATL
ncbi:MAG: SURF1 family cytochrome oxidase biogenesis protein, partial [Pseudolabrys sp.]